MTYYLDTSALVKMYHREAGFEQMDAIYNGTDTVQLSELTRVEFVSAMVRKLRGGNINEQLFQAALEQFSADLRRRFEMFSFTGVIIEEASNFLATSGASTPLRTLDALQFAFYRVHCEPTTLFVSADLRLLDVVEALGYPVSNPEE